MNPTLSDSIDTHSSVKAAISWEIKKCRFDASDSAFQLPFGGKQMIYAGPGRIERRFLVYTAAAHLKHSILTASYWDVLAYCGPQLASLHSDLIRALVLTDLLTVQTADISLPSNSRQTCKTSKTQQQ